MEISQRDNERQRLQEEEIRFNRQVNFFVMRKTWLKVRGRAKKGETGKPTIYDVFEISRERYTRILNRENVRLAQTEIEKLSRKTQVSSAIFEGKRRFQFEQITRGDWKRLFELRDESITEFHKTGNELFAKIKKEDLKKGTDLYNFTLYLKYRVDNIGEQVCQTTKWMNGADLEQLEKCNRGLLKEYLKAIERQMNIIETLLRYEELKKENKK